MTGEGPESGRETSRDRPDRDHVSGRTERTSTLPSDEGVARTASIVRTNDVETYYERRGDGPPVVFVHAAVMDHGRWTAQLAALSDEFTTIAYDVRGHGRTGGSARASYSIELFAEDLDALVTALDLERPILCGLSMGGLIAQVYAARHPDRIAGLVLAETWTPDMSTLSERLLMASLRAAILPVRLLGYPRVQAAMAWVHERLNSGARGNYGQIVRLQAEAPKISSDEFAKIMRSLTAFRGADVDYSSIAVPTVVLYGENEPGTIQRQAELLATAIADATVKEVPGGGHASNIDSPEFFTAAVRDLAREARESAN